MDMSFESRPRLIDRLRLFQVVRRRFGEEDAEAFVAAFQDEFSPVATKDDLRELSQKVSADMAALHGEMRTEINAAMVKMIGATALIAGIALAIARLT
ncbi:MAG: hypothetical protein OXD50_09420 [Chloroflexi bacterium]|nr:hypothetical protein [Chloroflexota bacterium]